MVIPGIALDMPVHEIELFCKEWDVVELSLFGSAIRDDFSDRSDVDVLVIFADDARHGLFDMVRMRRGLEAIFGTRGGLGKSPRGRDEQKHYPPRSDTGLGKGCLCCEMTLFCTILLNLRGWHVPMFMIVQKKHFSMTYSYKDVQLQDAVIRRIEVIGEAVRSLSEETKSLFPDLPWQDMADMRNFLIHQYGDVDPSIVWDTVELDLPLLIYQLERVVDIG